MSIVTNTTRPSEATSPEMRKRIERMFGSDRIWALVFVVILWLVYAFVFFAITAVNDDPNVTTAMVVAGLLVLVYNTASITAMVRHYREDMNAIYGIDIRHLDEMRHSKKPSQHIS